MKRILIISRYVYSSALGNVPILWYNGLRKLGYKCKVISHDDIKGMQSLIDNNEKFDYILDTVVLPTNVDGFRNYKYKYYTFFNYYKDTPKYCYTMIESSLIPNLWVGVLNKYFDGVIVPANYLYNTYKDSGVNIPIFVQPTYVDISKYYEFPNNKDISNFTFGCIGSFSNRKGIDQVIKAFNNEFINDNVNLYIKCDASLNSYYDSLAIKNVYTSTCLFNFMDLVKFYQKLNCYVFVSSGEGHSFTPREALSMGIPTILSAGHSHDDLIDDYKGKLLTLEPNGYREAFLPHYYKQVGYEFTYNISDIEKHMRDIYTNYIMYKNIFMKNRNKSLIWNIDHWSTKYDNNIRGIFGGNNVCS